MKILHKQAGYTEAILSLSFELQSLAKREETIYGIYQPSLRSPGLAAMEDAWAITHIIAYQPHTSLRIPACYIRQYHFEKVTASWLKKLITVRLRFQNRLNALASIR